MAGFGISLDQVHDLLSIGVLSLTGVYTFFKIKRDFFKNDNNPKP